MTTVGIEAINVFGGTAKIDVLKLMEHRQLETQRAANLLMVERTVALPFEDPVSYAVNAAKPIIDSLSESERDSIEMLITCTESGIDFGKTLSNYVHKYLGLKNNCRQFEVKQACYSGTAGFQNAVNFILSGASPGAKALVIATDMARGMAPDLASLNPDFLKTQEWSYAEPSSGAGAVAMLVSDKPKVFQVDVGANGYYGFEVMDTCRPVVDFDVGDSDLSLMSYLDCCENSFREYQKRVEGASYTDTFQYLAFHMPFGGMVKGAHRTVMRKVVKATREMIEADFERRVVPGMDYCQRIGNIMGATVFLSLASTIDNGDFASAKRIGCFSYGSGCCSEFYSGVVTPIGQQQTHQFNISQQLNQRREMSMQEYDQNMVDNYGMRFGTRDIQLDPANNINVQQTAESAGKRLYLTEIVKFERKYQWI